MPPNDEPPLIDIACDWEETVQMRPQKLQPVGYLLDIKGMGKDDGSFPKSNSSFYTAFEGEPAYGEVKLEANGPNKTVKCVGLITRLRWQGGKLDPIEFSALISPENKPDFSGITNTELKSLKFWVCQWDSAAGKWFETFYPLGADGGVTNALAGRLNQEGSRVMFDVGEPRPVTRSTIKFCELTFEVVPDKTNLCNFHYGHNSTANQAYGWGFRESAE